MKTDRNGRIHRGKGVNGGQFSSRQNSAPEISLNDSLVGITRAAKEVGVSVGWLRQLTDQGRISFQTTAGGHRRFDLDVLKDELAPRPEAVTITRPLQGLSEDLLWKELSQASGDIPDPARRILGHGVTEMVNNAIDHSSGESVRVSLTDNGHDIEIVIADDGVGAFHHLAKHLALPRADDALIEITKGKRTSAPERHAGEGLFFTLRAMDSGKVEANGLVVIARTEGDEETEFAHGVSDVQVGTIVTLRISKNTPRRIADVFEKFSPVNQDTGVGNFVRTSVPVHLIRDDGLFVARSEAKRLAAGLESHERVELDLSHYDVIGQGFADELFRVWSADHPETELSVRGANRIVRAMIERTGFTGQFID